MAKTLVRSVTINAPVETVFTFLSDPSHWMLAMPAAESAVSDVDIKPEGVGTSARWSDKIFGVHMAVTHEYVEFVPNERIVSKASVGPVVSFSLAPVEAGTELTVEESIPIQTALVRVPAQALMVKWTEGDIEAMVANIKSLVETGQAVVNYGDEGPKGLHPLTWNYTVAIDAPVEQVFELVKDPNVWLGPDVEVSNVKFTPDGTGTTLGVGTTFEAAWRVVGIPLKATHEYTEFVPNEHFTSKTTMGPVFTVTVAPEGGGTRLTVRADDVPKNWAEAAVDALVGKLSERSQDELLAKIKAAAEAGQTHL